MKVVVNAYHSQKDKLPIATRLCEGIYVEVSNDVLDFVNNGFNGGPPYRHIGLRTLEFDPAEVLLA